MSSIPYKHNENRPPIAKGASVRRSRRVEDTAAYILTPDVDFKRPYLAVPSVNEAFVWPLGVEGFEIQVDTQLGIHRYLGEVELDVSITHQDEQHITLSGVFPGWTSQDNMASLRRIYAMETPSRGKILSLPGIFSRAQLVVGENMRFSHAEDDRTQDIVYSASFVRVGASDTGSTALTSREVSGLGTAPTVSNRGIPAQTFMVTPSLRTLRSIAIYIYSNAAMWFQLYDMNADLFAELNIPSFLVPDYELEIGTIIYYQ
jgi:hypothetical protein